MGQLTVFTTATQEENALQLFLQIKIRKGWYIYSVKKTSSSISTKIELLDKACSSYKRLKNLHLYLQNL